MPFRISRSITGKLVLLTVASITAAVVTAFAIAATRETARYAAAKRAELEATAQVFATAVADALVESDRAAATRALTAVARIPGVRFAEILTGEGVRFASIGSGVLLQSSAEPGIQASSPLLGGSLYVEVPIVKAGRSVGTLGLLADTSELRERLKESLSAALLGAAVAVLAGLLIAIRLQRSVTAPIRALARTMKRVRETKDFSQQAERLSKDEIGQLVETFNDMMQEILSRDEALEAHRQGLERQVAERTKELRVARDAAESANRAKSDFLATMSHEIRTPMNGMLVMAELLAGAALPPREKRYAGVVLRSGQTLLAIINDILDLSKIEAGKLTLEATRVDLAALVEDVLSLFWERAAEKGLDLAALIERDVPAAIEADPVRLSQILSNLVNNALKFTERGHVLVRVAARTRSRRTEILVSVEDTGIGIPVDKLDAIFSAFSQADQSTTRQYGGTGLGLTICRRLADAMGGRIDVASTPGEGSIFTLRAPAPVLERASPLPNPGGRRTARLDLSGQATSAVIRASLEDLGCVVLEAASGEADLVFAGEAGCAAMARTGSPSPVVAVAGIGASWAADCAADGEVAAVLNQPATSPRVRALACAVLSGAQALERGAGPPPSLAVPAVRLAGVEILVADDSPVNREVVGEALQRLGARYLAVEDGGQAVAAYRRQRFDAVLMDCSMPVLDGFAATRALRDHEQASGRARTPVIALTAHIAGAAREEWRDAGMDDYLTKPFTMRSLTDCLQRWVTPLENAPRSQAPPPALPPPAEEDEAEPALDPEVLASLREMGGGGAALLAKVFALFRTHTPARMEALARAITAGDLARVAAEAHALKSPSLNIGARRLAAACGALEARARGGDRGVLSPDALQIVVAEYEAVLGAIAACDQPARSVA